MKRYNAMRLLAGTLFLFASTSLFATEHAANDVLNKAYKYIGSMDKYAFKAVVLDDDVQDGKLIKQKFRHDVTVKVDRPDKLRVDVKGDSVNRSSYFNDGAFVMMDYGFGYYGMVKTPKNIDAALDTILEIYGIKAPLAQLIYSDMDKRFKFSSSKSFGKVMLDGVECDYVAFSDAKAEVHIWVTTGDKPLIKAYRIFDKTVKDHPGISTTLTWLDSAVVKNDDFVFTAPKDAMQISVLSENE